MTDFHLTESLIRRRLKNDLDIENSVRLLVHLDRGCYACSKVIRAVAVGDAVDHQETGGKWVDPVALALWRWICILRGDPRYPTGVTAPHVFWAERLPLEPPAFGRVVIEEAFRQALTRPREAPLWQPYEEFLENSLANPALAELGGERWFDLRALARAYFAYPFQQLAAIQPTAEALRYLEQGTGHPEIQGTVWLYLSFCGGLATMFLPKAETHISRFIAATPSPGHHADLLVAQATALINERSNYAAYEKLLQAKAIVPGPCRWLKFSAARKLGCLEGWNLVPEIAGQQQPSRYLLEAETLSRELPGWLGKSLQATGQAELLACRYGPARAKLREALSCYREEDSRKGILECLRHLHSVAVATGDHQGSEHVKADLREVVSGNTALTSEERHEALSLARELGDLVFARAALEPRS